MKIAYCDYIAHLIYENLLSIDDSKLLDRVGRIKYDSENDRFLSTMKTIDVTDCQNKQYRITIQEL